MMVLSCIKILLAFAGYVTIASILFGLLKVIRFFWRNSRSSLFELSGPLHESGISIEGDFNDIRDTYKHTSKRVQWFKDHGSAFAFRGFMGTPTLMTSDPVALNFILTSPKIQKPSDFEYILTQLVGPGVISVKGNIHQNQRRIMDPAFGQTQIRELTGIFVDKSAQLESILSSQITRAKGEIHTDVLMWLNRTTLEIIGLAGFAYNFDALLDSEPNELDDALSAMLKAGSTPFAMLQAAIPLLRIIPTTDTRMVKKAQAVMNKVGQQLVADAKTAATSTRKEIGAGKGKDLLTLLVRANFNSDGPKLSDEEVLAQVPTFLVAGYETTSTAVAWTLFALSQAPETQTKLRKELRSLSTSSPTMEQLNSLPYLENVVREILRLYAPGPGTTRFATEDIILPVSEPYLDRKGQKRSGIRMAKGDLVVIPILAINQLESIWGPDALEFKPERWDSLSAKASSMPGLYANILTFMAGPRSCIGYRFALVEWKAILFSLLRTLEFKLAVPVEEIGSETNLVHHPFLRNDPLKKHQLPMIVKFAEQDGL